MFVLDPILCLAEHISKRSKRHSLLIHFLPHILVLGALVRLSQHNSVTKRKVSERSRIFLPFIYTKILYLNVNILLPHFQLKLCVKQPDITGKLTALTRQAKKCRNKRNSRSYWEGFEFLQLRSSTRLLIMQLQSLRNIIYFNPSGWLRSNHNW